ncbi:uncharacterized protein NPIL_82051 [Nephila pilipes]|uniref:Gustatory receptor n=1 Tax=Nephila pilipes TaxID=299642 RepID=A0A8X6UTL0_NEPPI|nr:uncharacterized protein NPIL_82051 [Nephila pilipes]
MKKVKLTNYAKQLDSLSPIIKIMFICGLDITSVAKYENTKVTSKFKLFYQKLASMFWIIYPFYIIASIVTADILTDVLQSVNGKIARRSVDISAFFIWGIMSVRKKQVYRLLHDVETLRSITIKEIPKLWIITGMIIIIVVPFAAWMSMAIPFQDEKECKLIIVNYSFQLDLFNDGNNCHVLLIAFFFRQLFVFTLRTAVTVIYVIICCTLRNIFNTHSELGAKRVSNPKAEIGFVYFKSYVQTQEHMVSVLKSFEETMSLPIFLIVSSDFMGVMYGVVRLDPFNNLPNYESRIIQYTSSIIFISLRGIVSFLCISLAASEVHEASKKASDVQKDMLKRILISGEKSDIHKFVPFSIFCSNPPFILSAGGVFKFCKGLYLSALGAVLTYSLLIMQILK